MVVLTKFQTNWSAYFPSAILRLRRNSRSCAKNSSGLTIAHFGRECTGGSSHRKAWARESQHPRYQRCVSGSVPLAVTREALSEKQLHVIVVEGINTAGGACHDLASATARVLASVKKQCVQVEIPGGDNAWATKEVLASAMSVREHLAGARAGATT